MLGGLDDGFRGASRRRIEVKGTVNRRLVRNNRGQCEIK